MPSRLSARAAATLARTHFVVLGLGQLVVSQPLQKLGLFLAVALLANARQALGQLAIRRNDRSRSPGIPIAQEIGVFVAGGGCHVVSFKAICGTCPYAYIGVDVPEVFIVLSHFAPTALGLDQFDVGANIWVFVERLPFS